MNEVPVIKITQAAKAVGISRHTLTKARRRLGYVAELKEQWYWCRPPANDASPQA
jgi:hypothetical protein